jgi:thioredoxin-like negative regulator of GroEL
MKPWPLLSLLLLVHAPATAAPESKGNDALAAGLWGVAELHFRESLADPSLAAEERAATSIRLCESLIRGGNPAEALTLLGKSEVKAHPEAAFWKAQALVAERRLTEAVEIFSKLLADKNSPHRTEAGFTQASVQLALGNQDAALETLSRLDSEAAAEDSIRIKLYQAEILLDLGRGAEAREILPAPDSAAPGDRPRAAFLEAQLQLLEGRPDEAQTAFQALLDQPQGQSLSNYHSAAIGLADAMEAQGDRTGAAISLLNFIDGNRDSPLLDVMFGRILRWLPENPLANDPIVEMIAPWVTPSVLPSIGPIAHFIADAASSTGNAEPNSHLAFSLYTRAIALHRMSSPDARAEAKRLMNRLRVEKAAHPLAGRALLQMARWCLDDGNSEQAYFILDVLRTSPQYPASQGEAAFLEAKIAFTSGDAKQAAELFEEAGKSLAAADARTASLHAAIARLHSSDRESIQQEEGSVAPEIEADFELERALSTTPASATRQAIEDFLIRFPEHPRAMEARLAAAEAALASPTPDLSFAQAQLDTILASPAEAEALPAARVALARLRSADLGKDPAVTIAIAQALIDQHPGEPEAAEASLTLGRNLFQAGDYNPARLVLEKLAATDTDSDRAQAAWLLAARAASLGGTPQSKEEALVLFEKAGAAKGPVSAIVMLEKARHLIDMYRLDEAAEFLRKSIAELPGDDPLQLPAGLLLGEALYEKGSSTPESLVEALAVYDKLLIHAEAHPALLNRLQYLRGSTLERLPSEEDPAKKRENAAFQAYYSVLETTTPPSEWEYFERCGFRALALLEKAERWQSAIAVAKKIASFNGPRADEAATRANQLRTTYHVWED